MNQATFVCEKDAHHYFTRFTDGEVGNRIACIANDCSGWMHPLTKAQTVTPFQLWCFPIGWRPVCAKHRQIFVFKNRYYRDHSECEGGAYPYSDLAIMSGFRKVWLP